MSKQFAVGDRVLWITGVEFGHEPTPMRIFAGYGASGYGAEDDGELGDQRRIHLDQNELCRDTPETRAKYAAILAAKQAEAVARRGVRRPRMRELPKLISEQVLASHKSIENLEREQREQIQALKRSNDAAIEALQQELRGLEREENNLDPEGRVIAQARMNEMLAANRAGLEEFRRSIGLPAQQASDGQTVEPSKRGSFLRRIRPACGRSDEVDASAKTGSQR